jgi:hypothetical protein
MAEVSPVNEKRPTDRDLGGMTVNERMFACGVLDQWDAAVVARDRERMIAVLRPVALNEAQAAQTADAVLKDLVRYGL